MASEIDRLAGVLSTIRDGRRRRMAIVETRILGQTTCRCCGHGGLDADLVLLLRELSVLLDQPLRLTSGYRCAAHNASCGGHPRSLHLRGMAADVAIPDDIEPDTMLRACEQAGFAAHGIGVDAQRRFVHLDLGRERRWGYRDGRECTLDAALGAAEA